MSNTPNIDSILGIRRGLENLTTRQIYKLVAMQALCSNPANKHSPETDAHSAIKVADILVADDADRGIEP